MKQKLSAQNVQNALASVQNAVANARIANSAIQQHARPLKFQLRPQNNFLTA